MKEFRPRLTEDEYELIKEYRGIKDASDESDIDERNVKHGWLKTTIRHMFLTAKQAYPEFWKASRGKS